jgi:rhodanese-related sulfurtransferase
LHTVRRRLVCTLACALAILGIGGALGLLANAVSSAGIPLVAKSAPPGRPIDLADARGLFEDDAAHFIDARPRPDFAAGHIAGALSVPLAERARELDRLRRALPRTQPLVVYCEGGECTSALELSAWFVGNGWRDVRVLGDGYPVWLAAGFPVAREEER